MRILVATPIQDEFDSLTNALTEFGHRGQETQVGSLQARLFNDIGLIVAPGGLGKAQFGIQTQHLIQHMDNVEMVVCAGTAGGLHPALSIGDVAVATETVEHDFKWGMADRPPPSFKGDKGVIKALGAGLRGLELGFDIHFGPIASGDEGVANSERARSLHEETGALVVAWEGAGGARAAKFSDVRFLEIRGVSDGAGESASDEFKLNIPLAMRNVGSVLECLAHISVWPSVCA